MVLLMGEGEDLGARPAVAGWPPLGFLTNCEAESKVL